MTALAFECNARHVKVAVAHVTNRYGSLRAATSLHATKGRRTCDRELAGGRITGDGDSLRAGWIVARDRNRGGLSSKTARLEADWHLEGASGPNCYRVGQDLRNQKLAPRGGDVSYCQRTPTTIAKGERLVYE